MSTVAEINEAIGKLDAAEQVQLLQDLPRHLKIPHDNLSGLKLTPSSDEQLAHCYQDNDWAAFENRRGAASD